MGETEVMSPTAEMPYLLFQSKGLLRGVRKVDGYPYEMYISQLFESHMESTTLMLNSS
jgi:hypothetical protein